jgi:hypothetical protein
LETSDHGPGEKFTERYENVNASCEAIASKTVNALIPDAQPKSMGIISWFLKPKIARYQANYGGLWVGGNLYLTSTALEFKPNALNRALHKGVMGSTVALHEVQEVIDRFGVVTRIVDVTSNNGTTLTFRCYGARQFADKIRGEVARVRQEKNSADRS